MDKELNILTEISENDNITQRQLAKTMNMSLGSINALLQSLVKRGFIHITQKGPKTIQYSLTHKGMIEKANKTYDYVVDSFLVISKLKMNIKRFIQSQIENGILAFYLYGKQDEIYKLTKMCLIETKRNFTITYEDFRNQEIPSDQYVIFCWNHDDFELLRKNHENVTHIFTL